MEYTFDVNASGHPFYFTTDNSSFGSGSYIGEYTTGVTGSRTQSGTVTFKVPTDAPSLLYYRCGFHSSMIGTVSCPLYGEYNTAPSPSATSTPTPTVTPSVTPTPTVPK